MHIAVFLVLWVYYLEYDSGFLLNLLNCLIRLLNSWEKEKLEFYLLIGFWLFDLTNTAEVTKDFLFLDRILGKILKKELTILPLIIFRSIMSSIFVDPYILKYKATHADDD